MNKSVILSLSLFLLCSNVSFSFAQSELLSYSSASSVKRSLENTNYEIRKNNREISAIKSSNRISEYDKKRKIRELERENYILKRKADKLKSDYRKAIS